MKPTRVAIVSPFPPHSTYSHTGSALASFTANIMAGLRTYSAPLDIHVYADSVSDKHARKNPNVTRMWERDSVASMIHLTRKLLVQKHDVIVFQFEWAMFGSSFLFPLYFLCMLFALRLCGRPSIVVSHGVLTDRKTFLQSIIDTQGLSCARNEVIALLLPWYYWVVSICARRIVVLEEHLKSLLVKQAHIDPRKVSVIPHGVDTSTRGMTKAHARARLGIPAGQIVLGCVGFITKYKGSDQLLDSFASSEQLRDMDAHLYFIGGASTHVKDGAYTAYFDSFAQKADKTQNVHVTGFVPQDDLVAYICACDIVIVPHSSFLSASGPFSLALSYAKPLVLSNALLPYTSGADFDTCMQKSGLKKDELFVHIAGNDLWACIKRALDNQARLITFTTCLSKKRNWEAVAQQYVNVIKEVAPTHHA